MSQRILIVDDDATTLRILVTLLRSEGFAADGDEVADAALARLRVSAYDVLLTDLVMPGMTGYALVAAARELHPTIRCLIMSGYVPDDERAAGIAWVHKPIEIDDLVATLAGR